MKRVHPILAAALLVLLLAAGCGGDDEGSGEGGSDTGAATTPAPETTPQDGGAAAPAGALQIAADPSGALKFDKEQLDAKAGKVTITMDNPSSVPHAVNIRGSGVNEAGETVNKGGTSSVSARLKAGKYEFYCPVAGHDQAGMKGTLTVK